MLAGQVNRRHFLFAVEDGRIVGFVGWALATREKAEAWLTQGIDLSFEDSKAGEMVLANAWKASSPAANRFLVQAFRHVIRDKQTIYMKRFYPDGRVRRVRLAVNAFVSRHIAQPSSDRQALALNREVSDGEQHQGQPFR